MIAYHCDDDACHTWQRATSEHPSFYVLTDPDEEELHFCCLDHVMRWAAAHSQPGEVT